MLALFFGTCLVGNMLLDMLGMCSGDFVPNIDETKMYGMSVLEI